MAHKQWWHGDTCRHGIYRHPEIQMIQVFRGNLWPVILTEMLLMLISYSYYIWRVQHNEHAAFSSALPVSTFSTLSANTKIQITGTWCTVGSGVAQPNTVGAAVCCGHEQHGVILPSVLDVANNEAMCDKTTDLVKRGWRKPFGHFSSHHKCLTRCSILDAASYCQIPTLNFSTVPAHAWTHLSFPV